MGTAGAVVAGVTASWQAAPVQSARPDRRGALEGEGWGSPEGRAVQLRAAVEGLRPVSCLTGGAGAWEREAGLVAMADVSGRPDWQVLVDSSVCRAHARAASGRRDSDRTVGGESGDHALGVCRGGWPVRVHVAVDAGRPAGGLSHDGSGAEGGPGGPPRTGQDLLAPAAGVGR